MGGKITRLLGEVELDLVRVLMFQSEAREYWGEQSTNVWLYPIESLKNKADIRSSQFC